MKTTARLTEHRTPLWPQDPTLEHTQQNTTPSNREDVSTMGTAKNTETPGNPPWGHLDGSQDRRTALCGPKGWKMANVTSGAVQAPSGPKAPKWLRASRQWPPGPESALHRTAPGRKQGWSGDTPQRVSAMARRVTPQTAEGWGQIVTGLGQMWALLGSDGGAHGEEEGVRWAQGHFKWSTCLVPHLRAPPAVPLGSRARGKRGGIFLSSCFDSDS